MAKAITTLELDLGLLPLLDLGLMVLGLLDLGLLDLGLLDFCPLSRCRRVWHRTWRCRSHCPYLVAWPLLQAHIHRRRCTVTGSSSSSSR